MKDTLTSNTARDFQARYQGTYGFLCKEKGERQLVYLHRVNEGSAQFRADDHESEKNLPYMVNADSGVEFEFIQVTRGFFNVDGGVLYLARIPQRQWKRGISAENTLCQRLAGGRFKTERLSIKVLSEIFVKPLYAHATRFQEFVEKKRNAVALSQHFAIDDSQNVFFFDRLVGAYKEGVITLESDLVRQELFDVCNRKGLPVVVTVNK